MAVGTDPYGAAAGHSAAPSVGHGRGHRKLAPGGNETYSGYQTITRQQLDRQAGGPLEELAEPNIEPGPDELSAEELRAFTRLFER